MRFIRLNVRNPLIGALLLIALLTLVVSAVIFGLTLLVGTVVIGAVALLVRRILRFGRRQPPALEPLDSAQEVFPEARTRERLP